MNNILLVGNGFDLAHGLLTKYEHFLYLMKNWDEFYSAFEIKRDSSKVQEKESDLVFLEKLFEQFGNGFEQPMDKYMLNVSHMDKVNIDKLGYIIKSNSWAKYYCLCEAEIDGWIDFEREIYPVIELFDFIFNHNYEMEHRPDGQTHVMILSKDFNAKLLSVADLWDKYINIGPHKVYLKSKYVSRNYGILKKKLLEDLRKEFDEFIIAFELYLHEFVYKSSDVRIVEQVKELEIGSVISFNYTLTERLYGITDEEVHHIHGSIRDDLNSEKNNMVVGVNEHPSQNMDFIYFVKYFQRIQKGSGVKYKRFVDSNIQNVYGRVQKVPYVLYIYGHSLDETDEDILKYIIGNKAEDGRLNLNPDRVEIFYYNSDDYEQKVINLIKLYGRPIVEEFIEMEKFKFIPINE